MCCTIIRKNATLLRADSDSIDNRLPVQLIHGVIMHNLQIQMAVLAIQFPQPLPHQKATNTPVDCVTIA